MILVAYATFGHHDAALVQAVSNQVLHMPSAFDPQAIANILWALALLDDLSPPVWNCLMVSFVQAERFNSKSTAACSCNMLMHKRLYVHEKFRNSGTRICAIVCQCSHLSQASRQNFIASCVLTRYSSACWTCSRAGTVCRIDVDSAVWVVQMVQWRLSRCARSFRLY